MDLFEIVPVGLFAMSAHIDTYNAKLLRSHRLTPGRSSNRLSINSETSVSLETLVSLDTHRKRESLVR